MSRDAALATVRVDEDGIRLSPTGEMVLDLYFGEQRIGSFWAVRDTVPAGGGRHWAWPPQLRGYLDGRTTLRLVEHTAQRELYAAEVSFGSGTGQVAVVDRLGNPLGMDKSGRLMRLFGSRDAAQLEPLLDSIDAALRVLRECGVRPFVAYGTLLGAVRDGTFIGHDSDADLGYVSAYDHPVEVIGESFRLQRALVERGFAVTRYSGLAFKILVEESDGTRRGLDVFGGFLRRGRLYLMGEVGADFRPEWIEPLGEATLAGRPVPVPAQPERLLEAMYGPSWRVPDPAFKFTTPSSTVRRLNGWFRGTRHQVSYWDAHWARHGRAASADRPTAFARWVRGREPAPGTVVDLGCGTGADVAFWARQGVPAVGLDFVRRAFGLRARRAAARGWPARYEWANLTDLRSVLATGARLSREPGPVVVTARHVADATNARGREHLLRLARMAAGPEGTLYLQVVAEGAEAVPPGLEPLAAAELLRVVEATGGVVVERQDRVPEWDIDEDRPGTDPAWSVSRWVVRWPR